MTEPVVHDYSGDKPFSVFSESATFVLIDGFSNLTVAESHLKDMMGTYNNCGASGQSEQYWSGYILDSNGMNVFSVELRDGTVTVLNPLEGVDGYHNAIDGVSCPYCHDQGCMYCQPWDQLCM
jgi:hypothetical protein